MTPQQRRFTSQSSLELYRQLVVGNRGWGFLLGFELYSLLFSGMPSLLGLAARRAILPCFLGERCGPITVGKGVTLRCPDRIRTGRGVVIDDFCPVS